MCRCGTYVRIRAAIHDAAKSLAKNTAEQENTMHFDLKPPAPRHFSAKHTLKRLWIKRKALSI